MDTDDYNLKWNNFESGIASGVVDIFKEKELFDVTLVCGSNHICAHRLILSACSPVFRTIFSKTSQHNPIVYLRGVSYSNLEAALNFMYYGEVCIAQEKLSGFLSTAEDLQVKGLYQSDSEKTEARKSKKRSLATTSAQNSDAAKKPKKQPEILPKVVENNDSSHLKKEPTPESVDGVIALENSVLPEEDGEYNNFDYDENYELVDPENTEILGTDNTMLDEDNSIVDDSIQYPLMPGFTPSPARTLGPRPKGDRQPIVNFINLNKLRIENGYMCGFCNRISADNSNMNRHIEVKHSTELELYLAAHKNSPAS